MNKYPYIGKWESLDLEFLIIGENQAIPLRYRKGESIISDINGVEYKNITSEYLANTYGEVVSTEHVGFILELAKNAGFDTHYYMNLEPFDGGKGYMEVRAPKEYIYNDFVFSRGCLFVGTGALPDELACLGDPKSGKKQITIPLPPKADKQDSREWPQIGGEVLICNAESDSRIIDFNNEKVKVIAKTKDDRGTVLTITHPSQGIGAIMFISKYVKKPKTPEEELRDELSESFCAVGYETEKYIDYLMDKYDIKKKDSK